VDDPPGPVLAVEHEREAGVDLLAVGGPEGGAVDDPADLAAFEDMEVAGVTTLPARSQ
jgi:hypothetical protein